MTELEADVLSAIRRGEDSLPKLRAATGLEYAKLHVVLHELEFESRAITRNETAEGFDRYAPAENGNGFKGTHWKDAQAIPTVAPQANSRTRAAADAREMALLQREAPYCTTCRSLCVLHGTDRRDRVRWRCRQCATTFFGSGCPGEHNVNRINPEKREKAISAFNEGKSIRQVAHDVGIAKATAQKIRNEEKIEALCPCGEDAKHQGWCWHRFQKSPARQATIEKMNMAHLDPYEEAEKNIAAIVERGRVPREQEERQPDITILGSRPGDLCGCGYSVNHRGRCADGQPKHGRPKGQGHKSDENITKTITSNGATPPAEPAKTETVKTSKSMCETDLEVRLPNPANKISAAPTIQFKRDDFCLKNCDPATVGHHNKCLFWPANRGPIVAPSYAEPYVVGGFLRLHITLNIGIAEMLTWNPYDISSFFSALATLQKLGNQNGHRD